MLQLSQTNNAKMKFKTKNEQLYCIYLSFLAIKVYGFSLELRNISLLQTESCGALK